MKKFLVRFAFLLLCGHGASQAKVDRAQVLAMGESSFHEVNHLIENYDDHKKGLLVSLGHKITSLADMLITDEHDPRQNLGFLLAVMGTTMQGAEKYIERGAKTVSGTALTQIAQQNTWDKVNRALSWTDSFCATLDVATTKIGSTLGFSRRKACGAIECASFSNRAWYRAITGVLSGHSYLEFNKIKNYCDYAEQQNNCDGVDSLSEQAQIMFRLEYTLKMSLANKLEHAKREKNASEMEKILNQMNRPGDIQDLAYKAGGIVQKNILKKLEENSVAAADSAIYKISPKASWEAGLASYRLIHLHFLAQFTDDSFDEEFKQIFDYIVSTQDPDNFSLYGEHIKKMVSDTQEQHDTLKAAVIAFFTKHLYSSDNDHNE